MRSIPIYIEEACNDTTLWEITSLPPLSLYVHYPWCIKKCPYCDFNSHSQSYAHTNIDEQLYLKTLILDLEQQLPLIWGRKVETIFIGGGTPNLISPKGIHYLLNHLRALLMIQPDTEITIEANPGIISQDIFKAYKDAGINRVSIGVQTLNNTHLNTLGRIHNQTEALKTIEAAHLIFPKVNADLMYGLPNQSIQEAIHDIEQLIQAGITHISAYQLTIEPNTWFYHHPPQLPHETMLYDIEQAVHATLKENHFHRYEISAFNKNNQPCRHNLNYWLFGDYLGIGAGAHGKLTFHNQIIRTVHRKKPQDYLQSIHTNHSHHLFKKTILNNELTSEFMMNALRLIDGFSLNLYEERTGLKINKIQHLLELAVLKKLIILKGSQLKPTSLGINYLNNLIEVFL